MTMHLPPGLRRLVLVLCGLAASIHTVNAETPMQTLYPKADQQIFEGGAEQFTGEVRVRMLFPPTEHTHFSGAYVTFQPGARTAWHRHPAGQHMIVTDGTALTGTRDGKVIEFQAGETVWCPPDVDHWHGATEHRAMTHLVLTGSRDGQNVTWKEQVSDAEYRAGRSSPAPGVSTPAALSTQQRALVPIAAHTASGDLPSLQVAIAAGLEAGLSISEIREAQTHLYAYVGFPRALNGVSTLLAVVEARRAAGQSDVAGPEPAPFPDEGSLELGQTVQTELVGQPVTGPLFDFAPGLNQLLQRHLFGDLFARGVLDHAAREIVTVAALASVTGVEPQLRSHIAMSRNAGVSDAQLADIAAVLEQTVGELEAGRVRAALAAVPPAQP